MRAPCMVLALALAAHGGTALAQSPASRASGTGAASGYVVDSWTAANGLPVNTVNAILQSRSGYIWLATFDGLVRFDGVRFATYNTANSEGLPSNRILTMRETRDGALWLVTEQQGLVRFRAERFTHFGAARGIDAPITVLHEDARGTLWVGTSHGIGRIDGERFVPIPGPALTVRAITEHADGTIWFAATTGELRRVVQGRAELVAGTGALAGEDVRALRADSSGAVWIGGRRGVWRYTNALERLPLATLPDGAPPRDLADRREVWVWSTAGLTRFDARGPAPVADAPARPNGPWIAARAPDGRMWFAADGEIHVGARLAYRAPREGGTPSIVSLVIDHEGSVWFQTAAGGLHHLKPAVFTVLRQSETPGENNLYSVAPARAGGVWAGSWANRISRIDGGRVTTFGPAGVPGGVLSIHEDRTGRLWLGQTPCTLPAVRCRPLRATPTDALVHAIHEDPADGALWFGTERGLYTLRGEAWARLDENGGALGGTTVRAFLRTADGALWMGTNGGGLARYRDGAFTRVTTADGLPSDLVRALYQDGDGWLWIGTEGMGLARLDPREWSAPGAHGRIVDVRTRDGLFDDGVHVILEDAQRRLWMSSNRGIFWVPRAELDAFADGRSARVHSTGYDERDGLRNREANGGSQPAGTRTPDGRLWFATQDGVAVVDPARIGANVVRPNVAIERVVAGDTVLGTSGGGTLEIQPGRRDLHFEFTALSFLAPDRIRFRYRLTPYDTAWVDAETRRSASYTRVPPGRYTFRVVASVGDDVWTAPGPAVELRVVPRFFETRTFTVLVLLALAALVWVGVRWRLGRLARVAAALGQLVDERTRELRERETRLAEQNAQLEAQAGQLRALDRARTRTFANVSHEFRTPLTLIVGPLEELRARTHGDAQVERWLDIALRNGRRLLRLVNQLLDVAKLEAGQMRLARRPMDLAPFVRDVAAAFDPVAEHRSIALLVDVPADGALRGAFDPDAVEKILTNLLSNALKFTPDGGVVTVALARDGDWARLRVADTGAGFDAEQRAHVFERFWQVDESTAAPHPGTGIGLSLVQELVGLHGGGVTVSSDGPGAGAAFTVLLPLVAPAADAAGADVPTAPVRAGAGALALDLADRGATTPRPLPAAARPAGEDVPTLLVVDDNADLRAFIGDQFAGRFRVLEAGDGGLGIELARRDLPDVVISDVMMPGTDGHALVRALRASPETDFLPIILLTAQAEDEQRIAGLEGGADDYLVKPFDGRELRARVENLIAARRRLRVRYSAGPVRPKPTVEARSPADQEFLDRLRAVIEQHLADPDFGVGELASAMFQDRSNLLRRTRAVVDETPSDLLRRMRLERAATLLAERAGTVAEVAYGVGFNSVAHFCRAFRAAHGVTPSAYRETPQPIG